MHTVICRSIVNQTIGYFRIVALYSIGIQNIVFVLFTIATPIESIATTDEANPDILFNSTHFVRREWDNRRNIFTPRGQDDRYLWQEKIIIGHFENIPAGYNLKLVNEILINNYKESDQVRIIVDALVTTDKLTKYVDYMTWGVRQRPNVVEYFCVKVGLINDIESHMVYSHRFFGRDASDQGVNWLKKYGASLTNELRKFTRYANHRATDLLDTER